MIDRSMDQFVGNLVSTETSSRQPTVEEQLTGEKAYLERRLTEINSALAALRKNPEILEVFNLVSKVIRR